MSQILDKVAYGRLLADIQPRIIRTEEENEYFLSHIENLMNLGEGLSPEQESLLNLLVMLVENFEDQYYQLNPAASLEILNEG